MNVILASQSPRRRELMGLFRIPFTVQVADVDETMDPNKAPYDQVAQISRRKAEAIARLPQDVVIAADTIVVCDGKILGKPRDEADAFRMLRLLSGRQHQVMTGMTVLYGNTCVSCTEVTDIHFRPLTDGEILAYIATKEPMDKAGSYGIQGGAALFAERLEGDYFNVVGLPVCRLGKILREAGVLEDSV
ncbi:MAG: septum formation inhibitor Maf [Oscillospiraceae bacterium]|nr:septum formation inhibitor Maf [Oscillospiraceae bacterium]